MVNLLGTYQISYSSWSDIRTLFNIRPQQRKLQTTNYLNWIFYFLILRAFSGLTLLVGHQEEHSAGKILTDEMLA